MKVFKNNETQTLFALISEALFGGVVRRPAGDVNFEEVLKLAKKQAVFSLAFNKIAPVNLGENFNKWKTLSINSFYHNVRNFNSHKKIGELMSSEGIRYCIIKGCASASYYPNPLLRSMGDVDFLVDPENLGKAKAVMEKNGFRMYDDAESHSFHILYKKDNISYELHYRFSESINGDTDKNDITSNILNSTEIITLPDGIGNVIAPDELNHALIMLLHMQRHVMSEGIGLRHLCDWAVFVNSFDSDTFEAKFKSGIKSIGLWKFAKILSQMSHLYLGLPYKKWFGSIEAELCEEFMSHLIEYGNFGKKNLSTLFVKQKNMDKASPLRQLVKSICDSVYSHWPKAKKNIFILAIGFIYFPLRYSLRSLTGKRKAFNPVSVVKTGVSENKMFQKLGFYGEKNNLEETESFLNAEQISILKLISNSLFKTENKIPTHGAFSNIFKESVYQAVSVIAFDGMLKSGVPPKITDDFKQISQNILVKNIQVNSAHNSIHSLFEKSGIEYCILKGSASAFYYPNPELRSMGDIDFYIYPEHKQKVSDIMEQNGYEYVKECGEYHCSYKKNDMVFELHYGFPGVPIGECKKTVENYLSDFISTARVVNNGFGEFKMPDDFHHGLILLLHTGQHIHSEGIGLRHLCDWAVFVNNFSSDDFENIFKQKLENIGLWNFAKVLSGLAVDYIGMPYKKWIGDIDHNLSKQLILDIFEAGNFGRKNKKRSEEVQLISFYGKNRASKSVIRQLFITTNNLSYNKFPFTRKCKILLPVGWAYWFFRHLFKVKNGKRGWILSKGTVQKAQKRKNLYANFHLFEVKK